MLLSKMLVFRNRLLHEFDDVGVESTAQTTVRGKDHQCDIFHLSLFLVHRVGFSIRREKGFENMLQHALVGQHLLYLHLCVVQF